MSYDPIVPPGHHLGFSRQVDGAVVGNLYEDVTNKLVGNVPWMPKETEATPSSQTPPARPGLPPLSPFQQQLIGAVVQGVIEGIVEAAKPHVRQWWDDKAIPAMKTAWSATKRKTTDVAPAKPEPAAMFIASTTGVELAISEARVTMSQAEWMERFRAMVLTAEFSEQQRQILANAQIVDGSNVLESGKAADQLTPQQFADQVTATLEANPSLIDEQSAGEWIRIITAWTDGRDDPDSSSLTRATSSSPGPTYPDADDRVEDAEVRVG